MKNASNSHSNITPAPVLSIAGSDSSGGAGIQADLKSFSALGCYGMSVITALTAQNTQGVQSIEPVSPAMLLAQLDAIFTDIRPKAIKIGMLFNQDMILAVAHYLKQHATHLPIIVDPVMVSTSGHTLLESAAIDALITQLLPLATVITPNLPEAKVLLNYFNVTLEKHGSLSDIAAMLQAHIGCPIYLKAGHSEQQQEQKNANDYLQITQNHAIDLCAPYLETQNTHGTGCTLSAALAAKMAQGNDLLTAAQGAKHYTHQAIQAAVMQQLGKGSGPVHHFYCLTENLCSEALI